MVAEFKFAESRLARREIVARRGAQAGQGNLARLSPSESRAMPNSDLRRLAGARRPNPPRSELIAEAPCRIASAIAATPDRRYAIRMTPSHIGSALAIIEVRKRWNLTSASMICCVITPAL